MSDAPAERPWRAGPYHVIAATRMGDHLRLAPGEVMRHEHGAVLTTCPACGSTVLGLARLVSAPEAPTFDRPFHCGAKCKACDTWFQLVNGEARPAAAPPPVARRVPPKLADAGVKPPPRLPPGLG